MDRYQWAFVRQLSEGAVVDRASSLEFAQFAESDVAVLEKSAGDLNSPRQTLLAQPPKGTTRCIHALLDFETESPFEGDVLISSSAGADGSIIQRTVLSAEPETSPELFDWISRNGRLQSEDAFDTDKLRILAWLSFEAIDRESTGGDVYHYSSVIACEVEHPEEYK